MRSHTDSVASITKSLRAVPRSRPSLSVEEKRLAWSEMLANARLGQQRVGAGVRGGHAYRAPSRHVLAGTLLIWVFAWAVVFGFVYIVGHVSPAFAEHSYPRVGNLFQGDLQMAYAPTLSKWDVVGFTASVQDEMPQMITTVRSLNPEAKLLAYFPAPFIWAQYPPGAPLVDNFLAKVNQEDWWLYDDRGNRIGEDGYLWYINFTTKCTPDGSGEIYAEWLAHYIAGEIMGSGYWDGLILDGCDEDIRWLNNITKFFRELPAGVDCNRDGVADSPDSLYVWWRSALDIFLATLRSDAGASCIIVPNGNNYMYQYANGGIREDFPHMHGGWQENMFALYGYIPMCQNYLDEPMNATLMLCYHREGADDIFAPPRTSTFARFLRFTLSSALLGDGYYFLDGGAAGSLWWQDYYDLDVGIPVGPAYLDTIVNHLDHTTCAIWTRDFTNAKVWCNPFNRYVILEDGTWIWPEDGAVKVGSLPGAVGCAVRRETVEREFNQKQRMIAFDIVVSNPNTKAAMAYVWLDLLGQGGTPVASGSPFEQIVGAGQTDTLRLGLTVRTSLELGTYCLRARVGGPGKTPTDEDTVYVTKVVAFPKNGKAIDDDRSRSSDTSDTEEDNLVVYPQPLLLSSARTLSLDVIELTSVDAGTWCSINIYDAAGRLVHRVYEGKLDEGRALVVDEGGKGGVPKVPGVYFLRVETRAKTITKKIVLLR